LKCSLGLQYKAACLTKCTCKKIENLSIYCCFSFSNIKIPIKQVESHHTTHLECHRSGIIVITKAQREICVDPTERWVQRLINLVDARNMKEIFQTDFKLLFKKIKK
uniref:Chemokine interleukin-8-like domain-containing protein n=1 Tax=Sinocyclocheilus anshuiensis TaxID=1608454 RepID=A0A671NYH0_9TELE